MPLNTGTEGLLEQSYGALKEAVYGGLVLQTDLRSKLMESMHDEQWRMAA